jgi:hypothetical protein
VLALAAVLAVKIVLMVREQAPIATSPPPSAAPPKRGLEALFAGTRPGLVGLGAAQLGMTKEELAKANPELAAGGVTTPQGVVCVPEIDRSTERLEAVNMLLGTDLTEAERVLVTAWGEPARGSDAPGKPALFWHDAPHGVRAVLRATTAGTHVEVRRMTTVDALLGGRSDAGAEPRFGFEVAPLLGATIDELKKSYVATPRAADAASGADVVIVLPVTEYGWRDTRVHGYTSGGRITRFTFEIEYGRAPPGWRERVLAAIEDKLGKPEVVDAGALGSYRVFRGARLVLLRDEATFGAWHLSVEGGELAHDAGTRHDVASPRDAGSRREAGPPS